MSFVNIHPFLSFRPATHSKKSWDSKHLPLVMLPFLFTTLKRRLGTEDTKWWSVSGVILSHSSCKQSLKVGNSTGSSLSHFALQNAPHILYWRQVGTAGRPVKYPYPLPPQPGLVMCAECGFALSCWNMHGRPWKRCLLEGSILCSKSLCTFQH